MKFVFLTVCLLVSIAASVVSQTLAVFLPQDGSGEYESGMVYPASILHSAMQGPTPPPVLPLEAVAAFPPQEREGKRIVLFNPHLTAPTPIWDVQLHGEAVGQDITATSDEEFAAVEKTPEFDLQLLMSLVRYPEEARSAKVEGRVIVGALVGYDGIVERVRIEESDHQMLSGAAAEAVAVTPFTPASVGGAPARIWVRIPVQFSLD